MTNVTKAVYVNKINEMRTGPRGKTPRVNTTDIGYAAAQGVTVVSTSSGTFPANATTGELPGSPVDGSDIRALVVSKAQAWSRVRKIRYELTGDVAPAGTTYDKYGYITSPNPATSVPSTGNNLYDALDAGENIDQGDWNAIINSLKSTISSDNAIQEHLITYCHSQCHSQCHGSRGRR